MTINIRVVGMELTDAIRLYTEDKISVLEKYTPEILRADIVIGKETSHHNKGDIFSCSVTMQIPGDVIKVERDADDLYKAIDKVKDHLRETLAQHKEKRVDARKK